MSRSAGSWSTTCVTRRCGCSKSTNGSATISASRAERTSSTKGAQPSSRILCARTRQGRRCT
eukprot:5665493-Prymnesium_polylepis.1